MPGVKIKGNQLNITDIASKLAADNTAVQDLANSITSDPVARDNFDQLYLRQDGSQSLTGNLNLGGNDITNVGTIDGRDVSVDGSLLDLHLLDMSKHRVINDGGTSNTELWSAQKISTEFGSLSLNSLADVNIPSPQLGDILYFNGAVWQQLPNNKLLYGDIQTTDEQVATVLSVNIPVNTAGTYQVMVQGFELATGSMRSEIIHGAIKHVLNTVIVVDSNVIDLFQDVGTSAWSLTAIHNNVTKSLDVKVIGEAGKTIRWRARVELMIG